MLRIAWLGVLGGSLCFVQPTFSQGPPDKGDAKRIEAELEKLRGQIRELEAALQKSKPSMDDFKRKALEEKKEEKKGPPFGKKEDGKGPWGKGPWGEGPPWAKKDGKGPWGAGPPPFAMKKDGKGPFPGGPSWMRGGFGRPAEQAHAADLERRLDRILRDLEELRRDIRSK